MGTIGGLTVVSLMRPWWGILTWSWIGYMNPHKLTWDALHLPFAEVIAAVTLLGLVFTRDRRSPPWTFEMVVMAAFFVHMTMTTVFAWYPAVAWPQWTQVSKILLFTFITPILIYGRSRIHALLLVIVLSIGFYGFKGGVFVILSGGQDRVYGPPGSFIAGNNAIGLAMCMVLPLALLVAREESRRWMRIALYAVFWLSIPAIICTYSRGAFLGLIMVMVPLFWRYKGRMVVLALAGVIASVAVQNFLPEKWVERQESTLNYQEDWSAMQRIQAWGVATNIALDRPLLGAGFNFEFAGNTEQWLSYANFLGGWEGQTRSAHSIYFEILGQHGFVGLFLFMALLLGTFIRLHRLGRMEYDEQGVWIGRYAKAMEISLVPFMISGAFLSMAYFDLFFAYCGISAILHREQRGLAEESVLSTAAASTEYGADSAPTSGGNRMESSRG